MKQTTLQTLIDAKSKEFKNLVNSEWKEPELVFESHQTLINFVTLLMERLQGFLAQAITQGYEEGIKQGYTKHLKPELLKAIKNSKQL